MDTLENANGMTVEFKDPTDFREPEGKPAKLRLVRPNKKAKQPSRELVDLKAIEAECVELAKSVVIHPVSMAGEVHDDIASFGRKLQHQRAGYLTTKEYVMSRLGTICAALDEGIADCDTGLDYVVNGIGPGTPPEAA